ncbi:MAG: hypothetical protein PUB19_08030 [Lachnospiraceae bacterium]|nr:hypothetical protein [Lachnospiraceae bacterium]
MNRRNNRRYREKKPLSTESIVASVVGGVSILFYLFTLLFVAGTEGTVANVFGGVSVLAMIVTIVALVQGAKVRKNDNFDKVSRVLGVVVPALGAALWVILYMIGILMG